MTTKSPKTVVLVNMADHSTFHESMTAARDYIEDTLWMTAAFMKSNRSTGVSAAQLERRVNALRSQLGITTANLNITVYGKVKNDE